MSIAPTYTGHLIHPPTPVTVATLIQLVAVLVVGGALDALWRLATANNRWGPGRAARLRN